jgi:prefoldin subunit 5
MQQIRKSLLDKNEVIANLQKQVEDLNGVIEELDLLIQPQGSVLKFLQLRNFERGEVKALAAKPCS